MGGGRSVRRAARAQVSMEYLLTMTFVILITAPLIVLYYSQTVEFGEETRAATAQRTVQTIAQAADIVYYLGAPSSRTVTIEMPEGTYNLSFTDNAVTLSLAGGAQANAFSVANLTGEPILLPGTRNLIVTALPDSRVNISEA